VEETTRVLAQASTSTNSRDVLTLEVHAVYHTASESLPLAALLDKLDPLVFTPPPTMSLPFADRTMFLLSVLMEMEVLLFHGKHVALLPLTLLNTLVVT